MNTVDLSEESIERVAQRLSELLRHARTSDILTLEEAVAYAKHPSRWAFYKWASRWRVKPQSRGRYSRNVLDLAIAREAGLARTPASMRRST
jgi:hypothetical protein